MRKRIYQTSLKAILDFFVALTLLILSSPVIILCVLLLSIANHGQIFFIQTRPGYKEKPFGIIKFKTMNDNRDKRGILLPDDQRLTKIGKLIRNLSIDELLQLINVLKGDMSLVGPRPLLMEYLPLYNEFQKRRHDFKPGITGWAQVNGRNAISWEQKFENDIWYVENVSFLLDLKILFLTIRKVLLSEGISSTTSITMEKFTGNNKC